MENFDEIFSFKSLYLAHRKARLGKRHKKEVIQFEMNLSENLWKIYYELKYKKYTISKYNRFMIYDPKEREIQAISYKDRIVQHALCDNYLSPLLKTHLIYDNVACQKNKGTSLVMNRIRKFMCKYYQKYGNNGYVLQIDISKYFLSIDHTILKAKLCKMCHNDDILFLLFEIIDSFSQTENKGLPMGNQTSQCFAIYYLDSIDRLIIEIYRIKYYVRYMDDLLLFVKDKAFAKELFANVKNAINILNLDINPKSKIVPIKDGFTYMAWKFRFGGKGHIIQTIKKSTRLRILRKINNSPQKDYLKMFYKGFLQSKRLSTFRFEKSLIRID